MTPIETVQALTKLARELSEKFVFTAEHAGEIAATLNAGDALAVELARRNKEDPCTRLHNLCDAISEDADKSVFSREEWDRIDAENVALAKANKELRAALAQMQAPVVQVVEPLTEEEIIELRKGQSGRYGFAGLQPYGDTLNFARAIEANRARKWGLSLKENT